MSAKTRRMARRGSDGSLNGIEDLFDSGGNDSKQDVLSQSLNFEWGAHGSGFETKTRKVTGSNPSARKKKSKSVTEEPVGKKGKPRSGRRDSMSDLVSRNTFAPMEEKNGSKGMKKEEAEMIFDEAFDEKRVNAFDSFQNSAGSVSVLGSEIDDSSSVEFDEVDFSAEKSKKKTTKKKKMKAAQGEADAMADFTSEGSNFFTKQRAAILKPHKSFQPTVSPTSVQDADPSAADFDPFADTEKVEKISTKETKSLSSQVLAKHLSQKHETDDALSGDESIAAGSTDGGNHKSLAGAYVMVAGTRDPSRQRNRGRSVSRTRSTGRGRSVSRQRGKAVDATELNEIKAVAAESAATAAAAAKVGTDKLDNFSADAALDMADMLEAQVQALESMLQAANAAAEPPPDLALDDDDDDANKSVEEKPEKVTKSRDKSPATRKKTPTRTRTPTRSRRRENDDGSVRKNVTRIKVRRKSGSAAVPLDDEKAKKLIADHLNKNKKKVDADEGSAGKSMKSGKSSKSAKSVKSAKAYPQSPAGSKSRRRTPNGTRKKLSKDDAEGLGIPDVGGKTKAKKKVAGEESSESSDENFDSSSNASLSKPGASKNEITGLSAEDLDRIDLAAIVKAASSNGEGPTGSDPDQKFIASIVKRVLEVNKDIQSDDKSLGNFLDKKKKEKEAEKAAKDDDESDGDGSTIKTNFKESDQRIEIIVAESSPKKPEKEKVVKKKKFDGDKSWSSMGGDSMWDEEEGDDRTKKKGSKQKSSSSDDWETKSLQSGRRKVRKKKVNDEEGSVVSMFDDDTSEVGSKRVRRARRSASSDDVLAAADSPRRKTRDSSRLKSSRSVSPTGRKSAEKRGSNTSTLKARAESASRRKTKEDRMEESIRRMREERSESAMRRVKDDRSESAPVRRTKKKDSDDISVSSRRKKSAAKDSDDKSVSSRRKSRDRDRDDASVSSRRRRGVSRTRSGEPIPKRSVPRTISHS